MDDFRHSSEAAYAAVDVPDSVVDILAELRCYLQVGWGEVVGACQGGGGQGSGWWVNISCDCSEARARLSSRCTLHTRLMRCC
jgi:hypothetical protein